MMLRTHATAAALSCLGLLGMAGCGATAEREGAVDADAAGGGADRDAIGVVDAGAVGMDDGVGPRPDGSGGNDGGAVDARGVDAGPMDGASRMDSGAPGTDGGSPGTDGGAVRDSGHDAGNDGGSTMPAAMNIYYGTTHMHTGCCNNHGETNHATAAQVFAAAKANPNRFDFMFLTEHSGSTGPASVPMNPATFYSDVQHLATSVTDSGFVGFAGFEFSDNDGGGGVGSGHMTAVNTADFVSADGAANNAATLEDYLVAQAAAGHVAYGGFNHPGASGHPGAVASLLTPARRAVIVMNEVHNSYVSDLDNTYFSSFIAALDHGWRVAPTCGLDGHGTFRAADTRPEPGPCRTGVLAPSLTRANLDAAFMARRIYSTRDLDMRVSYTANGFWMGSQIGHPSTVAFDIHVSDPDTSNNNDRITKLEILTEGGVVVATQTFDTHAASWQVSVPANNRRYFLLRIFNGERTTYTAAAAPVWLE